MLKANLAYLLGSAANSAALLVLIPYLVNALPPAAYGAWAIYEVALILLAMLITAGMEVGLMREYWYLEDDEARRRLTGTVMAAVVGWGVVLSSSIAALTWLATANGLIDLAAYGGAPGVSLVALIGLTDAAFTVALTVLRIREQAASFALLSSAKLILLVGGVIAGTQLLGGIQGALVGRLAAALPTLIGALWLVRERLQLALNRAMLGRVLRYGLPLLPTGIASYVLLASDRFVLQAVASLEAAAIYTFAYKIATTLDVLVTRPFALDWAPRRFKIATQSDPQRRYVQALLLYLGAAGAVTLLILAGTPLAYAWIAPPVYAEGAAAVPVILFAYLVYGLSQPLNVGVMLRDKTIYLPLIGAVSAAVCLGLNLWWIPSFGFMGAAWATLAAYTVWTIGIAMVSLRIFPIAYPVGTLLALLAIIVMGFLGLTALEASRIAADLPLAALGLRLAWVGTLCIGMAALVAGHSGRPLATLLRRMRP